MLAVSLAASTIHAQTATPIEPDRPDVTNSAHIVGAGVLQIEAGVLLTRSSPGAREFGSPFMARLGLAQRLELRVGGDGWLRQSVGSDSVSGFGNLQLGAKIPLRSDAGGAAVLSVLPQVTIPTASATGQLGSGVADYTAALLTGADLGRRGRVDINYGLGEIGAGGGAHFVQHLASVSASVAVASRWNPYAELFWYSRQKPGGRSVLSVDSGAIYAASRRLALDAGLQVGVTAAADDVTAFAGVSVIVGDILADRAERRQHERGQPQAPRRTK